MTLKVALLGCGNVGSQVARILLDEQAELAARIGATLELTGIAVRNVDAPREGDLPRELFTTDAEGLIDGADVVIELMGGLEPAGTLIKRSLNRGASVVTGNKALLAAQLPDLTAAAHTGGAQLLYEAAVAGAIPILRPIRESLAGDHITKVLGIVNGTTNFILDAMDTHGSQFEDVLAEAQRLGYAEADPTADVAGHDAAAKAALLASLAFHTTFDLENVYCEGITEISADDVAAAADAGMVVKLLAIAEKTTDSSGAEGINVRVHPTLLSRQHPLAAVRGAFNAVFVEAENAGELMFYGQGAGGAPTASAVMGDVVSIARDVAAGGGAAKEAQPRPTRALDIAESTTRYSISLEVADQTGVLAEIAGIFSRHGVSIETMRQTVGSEAHDGAARLRIITHAGRESALTATVTEIEQLPVVKTVSSVVRVEGK
ncbi:homoserine dehydrogenase [Zhihengliuella flava]|uniref:Homoserine dehydrogenase n=1 Tax=Zhihengliuella flava TaxID=1285193 RepID=A0A931D763_9MICC|nr:homoserine dehydrogenase [Zhihengliuella flava]MBG6083647.1 homoserine dehydrogenase [Zhihengliuella flava]